MNWPSGALGVLLWVLVFIVILVLIFRVFIPLVAGGGDGDAMASAVLSTLR